MTEGAGLSVRSPEPGPDCQDFAVKPGKSPTLSGA